LRTIQTKYPCTGSNSCIHLSILVRRLMTRPHALTAGASGQRPTDTRKGSRDARRCSPGSSIRRPPPALLMLLPRVLVTSSERSVMNAYRGGTASSAAFGPEWYVPVIVTIPSATAHVSLGVSSERHCSGQVQHAATTFFIRLSPRGRSQKHLRPERF